MSEVTSVRCDRPRCSEVKGAANHWHQAMLHTFKNGEVTLMLGSMAAAPIGPGTATPLDFCSENCLISFVSEFISQRKGVAALAELKEVVREYRDVLTETKAQF